MKTWLDVAPEFRVEFRDRHNAEVFYGTAPYPLECDHFDGDAVQMMSWIQLSLFRSEDGSVKYAFPVSGKDLPTIRRIRGFLEPK